MRLVRTTPIEFFGEKLGNIVLNKWLTACYNNSVQKSFALF